MDNINSLVRENIRQLKPYSSARDEYSGKKGIFLDANENPFGKLNRYPDPHHLKLRKAIGVLKGVETGNIFVGNGSDEAIDLVFRIFCNPGTDKALTFRPTYGMYEVSAEVNDIEMISVPLNEDFSINMQALKPYLEDEKLKVIFICSPNNPTSNSFSRESVLEIIETFRGIVVIDEAYIDFSNSESYLPLVNKYSNLVVLQTFSKAWGAAGIRTGMAFAGEEIIRYFYKVKPPYNVSVQNQRSALRRLAKAEKYRRQVQLIKSEKRSLEEKLREVNIIEYIYPSDANFLLVKVKDADTVYKNLAGKGIIVRNRTSVVKNCIRITVGKAAENRKLVKALKKIVL